ncbi:MAG: efflux transporter outer membrane subunit [Betaproteobacteria bacterium]|nr:efflux transporter outer membrane subunit [Betaproteobacteria bacterium]
MTCAWSALLLLAGALAGCAGPAPQPVHPNIELDAADRYAAADSAAATPEASDLRWWLRFDDALLIEWVERALAGAPDIAIARERVAQADALLRSARAQRSPRLGSEATAGYNTRASGGQRRGARLSAGLIFDWDADLWGGLEQAERSAAANLLRSRDLVQATRLATAALAASGVIEYREAVRDAQLLAQGHRLQDDVLRVVRVRFDAGLAPRLDVERAVADLTAIEADQATAAARTRQAFAALQLLAGERPQPPSLQAVAIAQAKETQRAAPLPALRGEQPVGRPLDLLRQRADLRAAQRALEAAVADIGVARAALHPRLRLPGTLTLVSGAFNGALIDTVSASIAAVINLALFDAGERQAQVDAAESRAREAALVYRQTLLQALGQVESALVGAQAARARIEALERSARAAQAAVEDARTLYTAGLSTFLDVLDARRTLLTLQRQQLQAQADSARLAVATFEALGLVEEAGDEPQLPAAAS